jgi:REP element-mobilizing transposase RayT
MPRKPTILQTEFPYNIGARSINRDWFSLPLDVVWQIMSEQVYFIHHAYQIRICAFVLMSNHFHLIVKTPLGNLSIAMEWFMRETSRLLVKEGNRINQTYGGPYFRTLIRGDHNFLNTYKYIYFNPVKAGICEDVLNYRFSTLPGLLGYTPLLIPVEEDLVLFSDVEGTLRWLNRKPDEGNWMAVRRALRKREFRLARENGRIHSLEIDTL